MAYRPKLGVVKKNAPSISDPKLQRVIDTIYKDLNELSDAVNLPSGTHTFLPRDGEPGDIRLYEGAGTDGSSGYFLQGRFSDGWASQRLTLETVNPESQAVATDTTGVSGDYITAAGVTKYNLANNGDVGTNSSQVAQGDHNHNHDDLANIDADEHRQPSQSVAATTLSAVVGTADFWSRGDHVHNIDVSIAPIWTSKHTFGKVELYTTAGPEKGYIKMATTSDLIIDTTRLRITDSLLELGYGTTANSQINGGGIALEAADTTGYHTNANPSLYWVDANSAWSVNQKFGIGTGDPVRLLGIQDSTNPQIRLINDSTHYVDLQADSTSPIGNLLINPNHTQSSNVIMGVQNAVPPTYGTTIKTDGAQSQVKGWQIDYLGGGDFRYLYTDELHAKAFIADLEQALAGGQIIAKSVATLYQDWDVTAPGQVSNGSSRPHLVVNDLPSAEGMRVFAENDWIRVRQFARGTTNYGTNTQYNFDQLDHTTLIEYSSDSSSNALRGKFALGNASCRGKTIHTWDSDATQNMTQVGVIGLYYIDAEFDDKSDHVLALQEGAIIKLTATGSAFGTYGLDDSPYYFQVRRTPTTSHDIHGDGSNKIYQIEVDFLPGMSNDATANWPTSSTNYEVTLDLGDGESGELLIADAWGRVQFVSSDTATKSQTWKFDRPTIPNGGYAHGTVKADSIVLDYGQPGNGFYEVNAIDGYGASNSPYSQIVTWESGTNQVENSEFTDSADDAYWERAHGTNGSNAALSIKSSGGYSGPRYMEIDVADPGTGATDIQVRPTSDNFSITNGVDYIVEFACKYQPEGKVLNDEGFIRCKIQQRTSPYTSYSDTTIAVTAAWEVHRIPFTASGTNSGVIINFLLGANIGSTDLDGKVDFDYISFYQNTGPGTANAQTVRTRTGQLKGIFGQDEFGLYAGSGSTNSDQFFRISDKHFDIHNINLTMHSGAATTIKLDSEVPYLGIGSSVTDGTWSSQDKGFLVRYDATEGAKVYIGQQDGHYIKWGDTSGKLEMKGSITIVDPADNNHYAHVSAGYFETFHEGTSRSKFGEDVRVGPIVNDGSRIEIDNSGNLRVMNRQGSTDTSLITLGADGVLTVGAFAGGNITAIDGDNITTGNIQSNNYGNNDGTQLNLTDGDIKIGGSSDPAFFYDNSASTLTLTGLLDGANIDAGVLKAGKCLLDPSGGFGGSPGTAPFVVQDEFIDLDGFKITYSTWKRCNSVIEFNGTAAVGCKVMWWVYVGWVKKKWQIDDMHVRYSVNGGTTWIDDTSSSQLYSDYSTYQTSGPSGIGSHTHDYYGGNRSWGNFGSFSPTVSDSTNNVQLSVFTDDDNLGIDASSTVWIALSSIVINMP